jgi:hypothetical protein
MGVMPRTAATDTHHVAVDGPPTRGHAGRVRPRLGIGIERTPTERGHNARASPRPALAIDTPAENQDDDE